MRAGLKRLQRDVGISFVHVTLRQDEALALALADDIIVMNNAPIEQSGPAGEVFNEAATKVKENLGITLKMTSLDTDSVTRRAATQPDSFDIARGAAPHTVGFVEGPDGTEFVDNESGWMTLIPTIYNADTLGIRPDRIGRPIESWTELLNPDFAGKAPTLDISSIDITDMAMVCEDMGEITYGDKGNMTCEEIDKTIAIFTEAKQNGQFRAFWKTFDESVNLMALGEVVIQSMWSPAITAVRSRGIPCVYQPLK